MTNGKKAKFFWMCCRVLLYLPLQSKEFMLFDFRRPSEAVSVTVEIPFTGDLT